MKLLKLSLVAVVAAGVLSSLSAALLEEAIKDIDISGFGRYIFQSDKLKHGKIAPDLNNGNSIERNNSHRFTLDVNFKATLDDSFFVVTGLRYDSQDIIGSHAKK